MTDDTIGIDISKATLDIHRLSDAKTMSLGNCPAGFKALARFCAKTTVTRVVYEATASTTQTVGRNIAHMITRRSCANMSSRYQCLGNEIALITCADVTHRLVAKAPWHLKQRPHK